MTKDNIVYPSYKPTQALRQAQADLVEDVAIEQAVAQGSRNGTRGPGGVAPGSLRAGQSVISSITGDATANTLTATGHNLVNGDQVRLLTVTGGTGLTAATTYYVVGVSGDSFQVATTEGGTPVDFTTAVTDGSILAIYSSALVIQHDGLKAQT